MVKLTEFFPIRKFVAEFIGTMVLTLVSKGAAISLSWDSSKSSALKAVPGSFSGGLAVMMGILITGKASGGHINPCVSLAMSVGGRLPWKELPAYLLGQILGAGLGSLIVLVCYLDALDTVDPIVISSSQHIAKNLAFPLVLDQFVASFLLVLSITAVVDQGLQPGGLLVGLSVAGIGLGFGSNAGAAMNPAVDSIPRLIGTIWRGAAEDSTFWIIPLVVPFVGGIAAMFTYSYAIQTPEATTQRPNIAADNEPAELTAKLEP